MHRTLATSPVLAVALALAPRPVAAGDRLDGNPAFELPAGDRAWEARRLEAFAKSMLDGLAVWSREILRPRNERSPGVIRHEADRAWRMADHWESEIGNPLMHGAPSLVHFTLACALGLEARIPEFRWRPGHPKLDDWYGRLASRASFAATRPPGPG